ncbi:hypothetical protein [Serratia bockelmannii]|uniref:hypothetical protein n=1 Tax=Serratia bockelmannii TaxID=2703793 RepID=UPI003BEEDEA6
MNIEQARVAGAGYNDKSVIIRRIFIIGQMATYCREKYRRFRFMIDEVRLLYFGIVFVLLPLIPIINHQPSTINHQPSTINHQPSAITSARP